MFDCLISRIAVIESSVDFPRKELDLSIWNKTEQGYKIKDSVKSKILAILKQIPTDSKVVKCKINVIGSICTNQYTDYADIDIHIQPQDSKYNTEKEQKIVAKWIEEHRDEMNAYIGMHPMEVYVQLNPSQDLLADGCYDLVQDKWLKGPLIVPLDYNPYDDFSYILPMVQELAKKLDITLGELKRDVIDFQYIEEAIKNLPKEQIQQLKKLLEEKRDEIEQDVRELYKQRKVYIDARHSSSKSSSVEQAKEDVEMAKKWKDSNAVHKFMHRYQYTALIGAMAKMLKEDDTLSNQEIDVIQGML